MYCICKLNYLGCQTWPILTGVHSNCLSAVPITWSSVSPGAWISSRLRPATDTDRREENTWEAREQRCLLLQIWGVSGPYFGGEDGRGGRLSVKPVQTTLGPGPASRQELTHLRLSPMPAFFLASSGISVPNWICPVETSLLSLLPGVSAAETYLTASLTCLTARRKVMGERTSITWGREEDGREEDGREEEGKEEDRRGKIGRKSYREMFKKNLKYGCPPPDWRTWGRIHERIFPPGHPHDQQGILVNRIEKFVIRISSIAQYWSVV